MFIPITSAPIITEAIRTLYRPRVRSKYHLTEEDIDGVRWLLEQVITPIPITTEVHGVATHPEDDLILATAVSAQADYLVTGDRQLQKLSSYQGVNILSPRSFLEVLQAPSGS